MAVELHRHLGHAGKDIVAEVLEGVQLGTLDVELEDIDVSIGRREHARQRNLLDRHAPLQHRSLMACERKRLDAAGLVVDGHVETERSRPHPDGVVEHLEARRRPELRRQSGICLHEEKLAAES